MEEETVASPEVAVVKVVEDKNSSAEPIKVTNGDLKQVAKESKKEEEETVLDGEFIKVEKESIDIKHAETASVEGNKLSVMERSPRISSDSREFLEAQETVTDLQHELERVAGALKQYESENTQLKDEVSLTKEKLVETGKKYEELELNHKKLQEEILEAGERHTAQLNALQEALQAQEMKHKDLTNVKESFDSLSLEFESSRKKMEVLEQELQTSTGEAQKFEELHKQSGSHAESETKRALEFEKLLELAKSSAKEMEDQMASVQVELKGLYEKITENEKVEEALKTTTAELCKIQEEMEISKSQVLEMEKRLTSKEALINELNQELDLKKASESQAKEDISALDNLLLSTKEDLRGKVSELEEIKLKLGEEVRTKEQVEVGLKNQEAQVSVVREELAMVTKEKEALEASVADLTNKAVHMKELCRDLEAKWQLSDENFSKADSLLSQALANNAELEQKLKSLEELHHESGYAVTTTTQKNLELEDMLRASSAAAEEAKSELREFKTSFMAAEQKTVELEQQLNVVELKNSDAERELQESSEKISKLNATLSKVEEEKKQLSTQMQEYQEKISLLESDLSQLSARNSELELELKNTAEKCAEHEGRANVIHERSLELEDFMKISHSKGEEASKKVTELELLLDAEKYRIQELEEQLSYFEKKCGAAEVESKRHSNEVSELEEELKALQSKASSLEAALQMANAKEKELAECLNVKTDEKKTIEDALVNSTGKLAEAENLLEVLRNELNLTQRRLEGIESDLKAAGLKESEVMEKLKYAEEQLERQGGVLEQTTAKHAELESLHETLTRDSELKLQKQLEISPAEILRQNLCMRK
ncbi:unnamed protein product [Ilex paraguariensis]|uniref:WIT1/2 N-terminal helical bundle domain-containing protein n=1 Tax=Ilex paraguariensis TaxID=185542 RepID=A0ABC8R0F3_9AQUA